jgi:hypothetical protein
MKVHCASLVEEALKQALQEQSQSPPLAAAGAPEVQGLQKSIRESQTAGRKIVFNQKKS